MGGAMGGMGSEGGEGGCQVRGVLGCVNCSAEAERRDRAHKTGAFFTGALYGRIMCK